MQKQGLILEHVSKSFAMPDRSGVTTALEDINIKVQSGEFVCIVGPSGCGKSTILRLIAGLIAPTTGRITQNGKEITAPGPEIGMAFQKPTLFPWLTVEKNLTFSPRMQGNMANKKERAEELLRMAGLTDFRDAFPHQLSGGMAQRLALIRTMINSPDVFLLDEPLGALDAFTRMHLQDELRDMWSKSNSIFLMVTHDIDEALYMGTRVLIMAPRPGRIREDIQLDMPFPRNRTSKKFIEYRVRIMDTLDFGHSGQGE